MKQYMLTTTDNPYDPFTEFEKWYNFDTLRGYNSCELLARSAKTTDAIGDALNDEEIESAMKEIIKYDFVGLRKIVTKEI